MCCSGPKINYSVSSREINGDPEAKFGMKIKLTENNILLETCMG